MSLRPTKLQANNKQVEKVRVEMIKDWKDVNKVLYFQDQSYISEIIYKVDQPTSQQSVNKLLPN